MNPRTEQRLNPRFMISAPSRPGTRPENHFGVDCGGTRVGAIVQAVGSGLRGRRSRGSCRGN